MYDQPRLTTARRRAREARSVVSPGSRAPGARGLLAFGVGLAAAFLAGAPPRVLALEASAWPDSVPASSVRLDSLAAMMSHNRLTRPLFRYLFQPASQSLQEMAAVQSGEEFFTPYRNQFIRAITVVRLDLLADDDSQNADAVQSSLERLGEALHSNTREGAVRKYFLMKEGEPLDPDALADTERLLRGTSFLREAEIVIVPSTTAADSVDLIVVTRDRWSLGLDVKVKSRSSSDLRIADRNFGGWGHAVQGEFQFDEEVRPQIGIVGSYLADNLQGTFVRNAWEFRRTSRETTARCGLVRDRVAPQIRTIGALDLAVRDLRRQTPAEPSQSFVEAHLWVGRALPVGPAPPGGISRSAIAVAGAVEGVDFRQRPESVTVDFNRNFHNQLRVLGSLSFTESGFRKGRLLHRYGRTEDIPTGLLGTLTGGVERGEFATRGYGGGLLRAAGFSDWGYFDGGAAVGAFLHNRSWEDGVVDLSGGWFSDLVVRRHYGLRQFADVRYTYGFARRPDDRISLDDEAGLDHLRGSTLDGRERLVGRLESALFTPWQAFGFKFALFGAWSTGTVGPGADSFLHGAYFSTLGFGLRIHNARLILDPLEIRLSIALREPEGASIESFDFGNLGAPRFPGYDPGPPAVIEYR
jgi:hypothetical protein